jgi:hypothetical protein
MKKLKSHTLLAEDNTIGVSIVRHKKRIYVCLAGGFMFHFSDDEFDAFADLIGNVQRLMEVKNEK